MKATVFQGSDRQWYFRVLGANGEIMAQSEAYPTRGHAQRGYNDLVERIKEDDGTSVVLPAEQNVDPIPKLENTDARDTDVHDLSGQQPPTQDPEGGPQNTSRSFQADSLPVDADPVTGDATAHYDPNNKNRSL